MKLTMEPIRLKLARATAFFADKKRQWMLNIVIIVLVNLVGAGLYFRIDLTRNSAYSLSKISKKVVASLEEPLTVKVFFSNDLPAPYNSVARYLADLLEEYAQYGGKNFRYEFIDMEKQKEAAADFGVQPVQVRELKNDRVSTRSAYMGIAIVHGDLIESVDFIAGPENNETSGIEYKITTTIQKMNGKIDQLLKLDKPIRVTLYASGGMPIQGMQNAADTIEGIVKKANSRNYGKLEFNYVNPDREKNALGMADVYGIPKLAWPAFTSADGRRVPAGEGMIGMVVECGEKFEVIQLLSRTLFGQYSVAGLDNLDDRISTAIDNLVSINPRIGYITGHGERDLANQRDGASTFHEAAGDMYEFKTIDLTKEDIPSDIQTIIINGPRSEFADAELYKIDQYLMQGRSALVFLDSFLEMQPDGQNMFMREPVVLPVMTGLDKLLAHYGISVNRDIVLDENCYRATMRGLGEQSLYFAPLIDESGLSRESVITKYLKRIIFIKASSLEFRDDASGGQVAKSAIISSSKKGWRMEGRISFTPWSMSPPQQGQMKQYMLAAMVSGTLPAYFAGKEMPAGDPKVAGVAKPGTGAPVAPVAAITRSVKPARVMVVGTSEITTPNVVDKEGKSPNAVFLHNSIDYLNGNYDMPEMRSKGLDLNPLKDAGESAKLAMKLFNIAGLPLLVVFAGFVMWRVRIRRTRRIMGEFAAEVKK